MKWCRAQWLLFLVISILGIGNIAQVDKLNLNTLLQEEFTQIILFYFLKCRNSSDFWRFESFCVLFWAFSWVKKYESIRYTVRKWAHWTLLLKTCLTDNSVIRWNYSTFMHCCADIDKKINVSQKGCTVSQEINLHRTYRCFSDFKLFSFYILI